MQNIKHLLWSLIFTVSLSIPSFAIMGIKAPGPAVEPGNPSKVISATHADTADSSSVLNPLKVSGVPSVNFFYEANSTDTNGIGFIGPTNSTKNIFLKLEDETASVGQTLVVSNIAIDQTINTPIGNITADIWTLITGESSADVSDDAYSSTWDGVTTIGASKNALYDKISALETQVSDMIAAFSAAGLNSFSFTPNNTFPLWIDGDGTTLSVDVTDTSTAYAVDTVAYQLDGVGGFVNSLTNTTGDIWTAAFNPATDGTYTVQYQASDDKETPNIGTSSVYTIYRDATAPSVEAGEATTHDGAGTAVEFAPTISDDNLVSKSYKVTSEDGNTTVTDWTTFATSTVDVTLPSTMNNYRIYARGTDHLQSTDDYLVASYSGESETTYMLQETTVFTSTRAADSGLFGQSFTIASGQGGVCTGVVFKAAEGTVTADTTVTVRICNTPGTINMETDYASGSVVLTSGFSGLFTVPITSGPTLAVGSVYAVAGHVSHTMGIEFSGTGTAYTGGTMYATTATDWDLTGHQDPYDCVFGYVVSQ